MSRRTTPNRRHGIRKAAEQGSARAQFSLGVAYAKGQGVPQSNLQAAIWYRKAAEQGNASAQYNIAMFYSVGVGVPQDYGEAYFWASLAAATAGGSDGVMSLENLTSFRDSIAANLTKTDLLKVQERARKWFEDHSTKP